MCGRYALYSPSNLHQEHFHTQKEFEFGPRFNIAPSQMLPVIRQTTDGIREFVSARWGLLPSWVKNPSEVAQPINAKCETAAIRPMFRSAFRKSRVLVPADAFFEWKAVAGGKQPYCIRLRDESPLGFAGLLEHWPGPEGEQLSYTILTTEPNPLMAGIHNRMPCIIQPEHYDAWLDSTGTDVNILQAMLGPYPDRLMEVYPISRLVNSPQHDSPEVIQRIEVGL